MPFDSPDAIIPHLGVEHRQVLQAMVTGGATMEESLDLSEIQAGMLPAHGSGAPEAVKALVAWKPPLLVRAGLRYRFTLLGAKTADRLLAEPDEVPESHAPARIVRRGTANKMMAEYADAVGVSVLRQNNMRCSYCGHTNSHGLKKGGRFLCQVCFANGSRF